MVFLKKIRPAFTLAAAGIAFAGLSGGTGAKAFQAVYAVYYGSPPSSAREEVISVSLPAKTQARDFIEDLGSEAIAFLADENLSTAKKKDQFRDLLREKFDMATIGRFVLGPYWHQLGQDQQEEYQALFEDYIVAIYSQRFSDYEGQKFTVDSVSQRDNKDYVVQSFIIPQSGQKVPVLWHVRPKDDSYKIVDVFIENVSMAISKRSEFSSVIQRNGGNPEALLGFLRQHTG